jgi:hypothetical protein
MQGDLGQQQRRQEQRQRWLRWPSFVGWPLLKTKKGTN